MSPERWCQVEKIYHSALELESIRRRGFLAEMCSGDDELLQEVESLLAEASSKECLLDHPPWEFSSAPPRTFLAAGTRLGPYCIEATLGSGGMGQVYRARDLRLDRIVAIKVLHSHLVGGAELGQRFEREARATSALNHPNICTLYDIGEQDGVAYLVMEYVEGHTCKGPLPVSELFSYGIQISRALTAAHARGIIHRDLKPSNIMVTPFGIKILDFGLAKIVRPLADAGPHEAGTTSHAVLGTPAYMSPEQTRGEPLDSRSDIFSLGCALYEAATGRAPFHGPNVLAIP